MANYAPEWTGLLDQYLALAEKVLRSTKRPLRAREILERAYSEGLVPAHLYGRTQHKTLGARLSEDILLRRDRSLFFRTVPGKFFLREFLRDVSIPEEFRMPIVARRRERELMVGDILSVSPSDISALPTSNARLSADVICEMFAAGKFRYVDNKIVHSAGVVPVWSFVVVTSGRRVLSYRTGRYRDGRDSFLNRRTIGFSRAVSDGDYGLFDQRDMGVVSSGLRAAALDLDFPLSTVQDDEFRERTRLVCFLKDEQVSKASFLLGLVVFACPEWFEPTRRRLAINDLQWIDIDRPLNHIEDFDPWSQLALEALLNSAGQLNLIALR